MTVKIPRRRSIFCSLCKEAGFFAIGLFLQVVTKGVSLFYLINSNALDVEDDIQKDGSMQSEGFAIHQMPICRIVLENKFDFHYEVLESVALKYPLPWDQLNCTGTNLTNDNINDKSIVIVDFALSANLKKKRSEQAGWVEYFNAHLKNNLAIRDDGVSIRYGDLVDYFNYTQSYHAVIGVSCDRHPFIPWLKKSASLFCVLHRQPYCPVCESEREIVLKQSCWLNPMFPECFFLPTVFPKFDASKSHGNETINICTSGYRRDHATLASALSTLQHENVEVTILKRGAFVPKEYAEHNVTHPVRAFSEPRFLEFQRAISQCDILLPLISPETHPSYFPGEGSEKELSGVIAQIIGYRIPSVVHTKLYDVYGNYFEKDQVVTYDTAREFSIGLDQVIKLVQERKQHNSI